MSGFLLFFLLTFLTVKQRCFFFNSMFSKIVIRILYIVKAEQKQYLGVSNIGGSSNTIETWKPSANYLGPKDLPANL